MILNKYKPILFTFLFSAFYTFSEAQVKITDGSDVSIGSNSLLELESTNKGLLIPRVALNSLILPTPLVAPVPEGMQVYSLGGTVTDGFYYWNGTDKWVRIVSATDPVMNLNMVTKTVNSTLLITENLVLARGNITLTLPAVSTENNGLEITIKNVGTYTDLITVVPEAGKTLDKSTSSLLTRWKGRTFIANNSNWIIKEKETRMDNQLGVSESESFTTIAEAIAFLNIHMSGPAVIELGAGTYTVASTQTINLPYAVTLKGLSFGETTVNATAGVSGSPMFICQSESYFKMLKFNAISNALGNDAIRFTGSGLYNEVKDCIFSGFNKGIVSTTNNDLWVFEDDFDNCSGAGVEIAAGSASGGRLRVSETDFFQCGKGISLLSGVSQRVSILNGNFENTISGTDIGIQYSPATFTSINSMLISNNSWNNQGSFISGFDFSRADGRDANAFLVANSGIEDENPHCKINVKNNALTTTVITAGTFYKANWTNEASSYTCKWTLLNNRITYQPKYQMDAWAIITGNIIVNQTDVTITISIVKNGVTTTRYGETDLRIFKSEAYQPHQFSTVIYIPDMTKNDFLELYLTSSTNNDVVTFQDVQWFTNTQ